MSKIKNITILHSNDIHADFLGTVINGKQRGGIAKVAQYVSREKALKPESTLYLVAGDIFTGSVLDKDSNGEYSVAIMNRLHPDAATIGNHAVDHLLKNLPGLAMKATFPIVNANLYDRTTGERLFSPYLHLEKNGLKILLIGVVTPMILDRKSKDPDLEQLEVKDAFGEIKAICDSDQVRSENYDLKIIISHLGYKADKALARDLHEEDQKRPDDSKLNIHLIIGGHSHTFPEEADVREDYEKTGIIIVQAGKRSRQIGHLSLDFDTEARRILSYEWSLQELSSDTIMKHKAVKRLVKEKDSRIDESYRRQGIDPYEVLATIPLQLTQEFRYQESNLGNFLADAMKDEFDLDIAMIGSGSIRTEVLGPEITYRALKENYGIKTRFDRIWLTGDEILRACQHFLQIAPYDEENEGEYFQFSRGCQFIFDKENKRLIKASFEGKPFEPDRLYTVGMEDYHLGNFKARFDFEYPKEVRGNEMLTLSIFEALKAHLRENRDRYAGTKPEDYQLQNRTLRQ